MADVEIIDVYQPGVSRDACDRGPDYWVVLEIDEQWEAKRLDARNADDATAEAREMGRSGYASRRFSYMLGPTVIAVARLGYQGARWDHKHHAVWVLDAIEKWHGD